jgi:hypothetical protein
MTEIDSSMARADERLRQLRGMSALALEFAILTGVLARLEAVFGYAIAHDRSATPSPTPPSIGVTPRPRLPARCA